MRKSLRSYLDQTGSRLRSLKEWILHLTSFERTHWQKRDCGGGFLLMGDRIVSASEPLSAVARVRRLYNVDVRRAESGLNVKQLRFPLRKGALRVHQWQQLNFFPSMRSSPKKSCAGVRVFTWMAERRLSKG